MDPVGKRLWYVESHFGGAITLDDVAAAAGVSRFHLARAFGVATGMPIMRYVRARRLTEAARALAAGAPDILAVALDAGYGSHEAFTRAFGDQFGLAPEAVRARGLATLQLTEPLKMNQPELADPGRPRIEELPAFLIGGLAGRFSASSVAGIPAQWQRFGAYKGRVPGQLNPYYYGACFNTDEAGNFDYLCGVEVTDFSRLPKGFASLRVPANRYAVFLHAGHVSGIRRTWEAVMGRWLPASEYRLADAPEFERYGDSFDADTGLGGVEIWVPVEPVSE